MRFTVLAIAVVLAVLASFIALNWPAFTALTPLSVGFTEVSAPLGVVMLVAIGVVSGLLLLAILFQQAGVIVDSRRTAKELKGHRELADKAEASRFAELRTFLDGELRRIEAQQAAAQRELGARIAQVQGDLQDKLAESTQTLCAYLGEIEDKLDQVLPPHGR